MDRRIFLGGSVAVAAIGSLASAEAPSASAGAALYGLIGRMKAKPGQREALIAILLEGSRAMPGCLSYIVARDADDADAIWITEVWTSERSHDASLALPAVQAAIGKTRGLIDKIDTGAVTTPVGGVGLPG